MSVFCRKLGKGYPIVLIHGFCETHEIWNGFADELATKFEVFAVDLPGFGQSPLAQRPFSIADVADTMVEWIDTMKLDRPLLIGHSLGGYVTLAMARRFPERYVGIGLFQSTAYPDTEEKKANRNKVIAFVETRGTDPYIDTFVPGLFLDKKHPSIPEADRIARQTPKETLVSYAAAMRDRPSSIDFLRNFKRPVLILGGDQDSIIPAEITQEHGQFAPYTEVHLIKNVGHMAMYENPLESRRIIESFALRITGESTG